MTTLQEARSRWEKGYTEVSHVGDYLVVLVVIKKESFYSCYRYLNLGSTETPEWACSVDHRHVTAEECLRWAFRCFKETMISAGAI